MKSLFIRDDLQPELNQDVVFHILDCYADSPVYEQVVEEYNELEQTVWKLILPKTIWRFDSQVIYVLVTLGGRVSEYATKLFEEGNPLGGMMVDAMADAMLFSLQAKLEHFIRIECRCRGLGVKGRLEAPKDIPMEEQRTIWERCEAAAHGIGITEGQMFSPVKTNGYILELTEDSSVFHGEHNCRTCEEVNCRMRKVKPVMVTIRESGKAYSCTCEDGETILEAVRKENLQGNYTFACGGKGTCGKCRIQVLSGDLDIRAEDRKFISQEDLSKGVRLACKAVPKADCTIRFCVEKEENFEVTASYLQSGERSGHVVEASDYVIGIDIGTTTLAVSLIDRGSGKTLAVSTGINHQRAYGADVIARIQSACEGQDTALQRLIREDLLRGIDEVMSRVGEPERVSRIAIAGNTTMQHLLLGYSCSTLGTFPFTPVDITMKEMTFQQVFDSDKYQIPVLILPGISTFVGADITAGILCLGFVDREEVSLLIDLGTNGEMAIGNRDRILVTSTAAGPAFEGGNISCGVGSIPGAICDVTIDGEERSIKTIGDQAPIGICGTGVIAAVAELLDQELLDETGRLEDELFEKGLLLAQQEGHSPIVLTQKDIRELQLAKSAIRAGMETLLLRYGVTYDQISQVYLAGGFGYKVNLEKAVKIGILPEELSDKIRAVGNSSLQGAIESVTVDEVERKLERICQLSKEIDLSADKAFQEYYMDYMMFE